MPERDESLAGLVALTLAAASILLAVSDARADPVILKADLLLYETAAEVHQECSARNGHRPTHGPIPSCYRGDAEGCTIIARLPDDSEADLGGAALIARELNNCARGAHKFAVNPE